MQKEKKMNETEFWAIIERAIQASENYPDEKEEALRKEVDALTPEQVFEFGKLFDEKDTLAYRWDLWAAAYIIGGGCGDDSFMDFRASLICMGQQVFEDALKNPDSLAEIEFNDPEEEFFFEGYQYIVFTVYEEKTGDDMPDTGVKGSADPEGEEWNEDSEEDLKRICPNLYKKYSSNWA